MVGNQTYDTLRYRLDVGIGAWNRELEFAGTNATVWMSLELQIGNGSQCRAALASLARTLDQIGAPHLSIAMHLTPRHWSSPPPVPLHPPVAPPSLSIRRPRYRPFPSAGTPPRPPSPSFRRRAAPLLHLLLLVTHRRRAAWSSGSRRIPAPPVATVAGGGLAPPLLSRSRGSRRRPGRHGHPNDCFGIELISILGLIWY